MMLLELVLRLRLVVERQGEQFRLRRFVERPGGLFLVFFFLYI